MNVTLTWDTSPDSDITGYRVYYGPDTNYGSTVDTASTSVDISGLPDGKTMYFALTAISASQGESQKADPVTIINPYIQVGRGVGF